MITITKGDLTDPRIIALIRYHVDMGRANTQEGSAHALDVSGLQTPDIDFWSAWDGDTLMGIGALKRLDSAHGEVKSMHTSKEARRQGVGSLMLRHIIQTARGYGLRRLSLETGSWDYFRPAWALYAQHGFVNCPPFGQYKPDPNSVFMTLEIPPRHAVHVRDATEADIPAILALHNHHIANTLAIWRYELADLDERRTWFRDRLAGGYPVLVAEDPDGVLPGAVGYASYGPFRTGAGYSHTVEDSIYVRDDRQRRGIAHALMDALLARAVAQKRHVMVAGIGLPNDASVAFHRQFGFQDAGTLREIGWKRDQWLDLLLMQKIL